MNRFLVFSAAAAAVFLTVLPADVVRADEPFPLYSQIVGTSYDSGEGGTVVSTTLSEYDEKVRLIKYEVQNGDYTRMEIYSYEEDEQGSPCLITCQLTGEEEGTIEIHIDNHYDGEELTEAVVTDILEDGESHKEDLEIVGSEEEDNSVYFRLELAVNCLQYYPGYRNTVLRSGPCELRRSDDGRKMEIKLYSAYDLYDRTVEYLDDGSVSEMTQITDYDDEDEKMHSTTVIRDGDHYVSGFGEAEDSEDWSWAGTAWYQYSEEQTDEETGETYRSGTIKDTEGDNWSVSWPYGLFGYLNEDGEVIRSELCFDTKKEAVCYENGIRTAEERYDEDGLTFRREYTYQ